MGAHETAAHRPWIQQYATWTDPHPKIGSDTLVDMFNRVVATTPKRPATWFMGKTLTYDELNTKVSRLAAQLHGYGVRAGDRVAVALPNCPQHIIAVTAILRLGAIVVEHNPLYTAYELRSQFADHRAKVAIVFDKQAATFTTLTEQTPLETVIAVNMIEEMPWTTKAVLSVPIGPIKSKREQLTGPAPGTIGFAGLLHAPQRPAPTPQVEPEDTALMIYTSGTTGEPKGVPLTHRNIVSVLTAGISWLEDWGAVEEKVLGVLPLFHIYGFALNYGLPLTFGAQMVLVPAPKPELYQPAITKTRPTVLPGVPTLYDRIIDWAVESGADLSSIHTSISGAATLPAPTIERWEQATGGRLIEGYGLTETSPILAGNPLDGTRRPGYIGLPFPNTEIRIANPDNPAETMPAGEPGELLARGPQVFAGYLNKPEATERAFHEDWFRTGDMAVMEADGWIKLVARIKEIIITGGFNVYPDEVEQVMRQHPDITDIAVVGRPRADGSEDVVACVTLRDGAALDPEGMKDFARERLTRYKVPRTFYHFEELNRDQTGKVRRREVQDTLMQMLRDDA
ncbi:long-chain-fatty-acid--CoA ligase [Corynebacterium sp. p3-SID1056]|uniref:long-chain-fatty-acid--CoA ligase n=1 Tax=Corynebacterium sp. p3-SID1056 TaxID=2916092 RepID=UPI0021A2F6E6|nr:long-chain-fatty-acid--CoA ligase [Corynebacterium sp. p3-SID1056]MCT2339319.1 long-chain-fatty-acid--CoA ligase [Corynebacterium sp. p3-SID1056]